MKVEELAEQHIPGILIVDDVPANLKVLGDILKGEGYKVRPVPNGILALQVAERTEPDLILLDIMMPDLNGFEVCKLLKENPKVKDIPVIFISALSDTQDIVKALQSGGVDFITKPFKAEEVIARVKTHLKLSYQSRKLVEQSSKLQELVASRDKFFSIIAHDLRGPLGGFMSYTEIMAHDFGEFSVEQHKEMILELNHSAKSIYNLLENLLEWSRLMRGLTPFSPKAINLYDLTIECTDTLTEAIRRKELTLEIEISDNQIVLGDTNMLQSVIRNLVSNAIKFTPKKGLITISSNYTDNNTTVISIRDTGIGMKASMVADLFKLNVNSSRPGTEGEQSSGLGLILCKEFIERHGGELCVESEVNIGTTFHFTIPNVPI